ncbi:MAG: outer spore coat protein CotE [Ignavibacteriales bacterium]
MEKKISNLQDDNSIRTIITNAVYGKSTQSFKTTVYIRPEQTKVPNHVLGCNITGAKITECSFEDVSEEMGNVIVNGSFEIHYWYELNNDTFVGKTIERFSQKVPLKNLGGEFYSDKQVIGQFSKAPKSLGTMILNKEGIHTIAVNVAYELSVEAFGQAKLNIVTYQPQNVLKSEQTSQEKEPEFDFEIKNDDDD